MDLIAVIIALLVALLFFKLLTKLWKLWAILLVVVFAYALMTEVKDTQYASAKDPNSAKVSSRIENTVRTPFKSGPRLCQSLKRKGIPVGGWKCPKNGIFCYCLSNYIVFGGNSTIAYYVYGNTKGQVNRVLVDVLVFDPIDWEEGYPLVAQGVKKILQTLGVNSKKELLEAIQKRKEGTIYLVPWKVSFRSEQARHGSVFKIVITYAKEGKK